MRFKGKKQLKSETADAKTIEIVESKLAKVIRTTKDSLYEDDYIFLKNMVTNNLNDDDINRYRYWEWPQGVALLGF